LRAGLPAPGAGLRPADLGVFRDRRRGAGADRGHPGRRRPVQGVGHPRHPAPDGRDHEGERSMAEEPDVIRQQIDETRESLTEKLETLEGQVKDAVSTVTDTIETVKSTVENTVESVKSGVENTVETVKSSLSDTVDTVKETFDLSRHVDRHPWAAV